LLLGVVLPLAPQVVAFASTEKVPSVIGTYEGFFLDDSTGTVGMVHSVIDQQANRRFQGFAVFTEAESMRLFNAFNFAGQITAAGFVTGNGTALTGRAVFQGDLLTADGVAGSAGVLEPTFRLVPPRGNPVNVSTILLRPFPDTESPDLAGRGVGTFRSQVDPGIGGAVKSPGKNNVVNLDFVPTPRSL